MPRLLACIVALIFFFTSAPSEACLPPLIYFESGSARLKAGSAPNIDYAFDEFSRAGRGARLRLVARTDAAGAADANMRLARRRGEAVKAALVRRGVPAHAIEIEARGESGLPAAGPYPRDNADDRVVTVVVVAAPSGGAAGTC